MKLMDKRGTENLRVIYVSIGAAMKFITTIITLLYPLKTV
jgi:hypothetical protein